MEIINVTATVNSGYDPDTANNGGGYFQPSGTVTVQTAQGTVTVDVDDTSCGDFGSRITVIVRADGWAEIRLHIGSLEKDPSDYVDECLDSIADIIDDDPVALIDMAVDAVRDEAYRVWRNERWCAECR